MANPGTFDKCRKQIEGAIKRRKKAGYNFAALDLPYFTSQDKASTDNYLNDLKQRGFTLEIPYINSSCYGRVSW